MTTRLKRVNADDFVAEYANPPAAPPQAPVAPRSGRVLIRGVTARGRTFRPSDWAERLYYAVATWGPNREPSFNPHVTLQVGQAGKCIAVDLALREVNPALFEFLIGFALANDLAMLDPAGLPWQAA